MKRRRTGFSRGVHAALFSLLGALASCLGGEPALHLQGHGFHLELDPGSGALRLVQAAQGWPLDFTPRRPAFGRVRIGDQRFWLDEPEALRRSEDRIELDFVLAPGTAQAHTLTASVALVDERRAFEIRYAAPTLTAASLSFDPELALALPHARDAQVLLPVGPGRRIRSDRLNGAWRVFEGRGHLNMQMLAVARRESGVLLSWDEVRAELRAKTLPADLRDGKRTALGLWGAKRVRVEPVAGGGGPAGAIVLARSYRREAMRRGLHRPLASRTATTPGLDRLAGALLVKPLLATGIAADSLHSDGGGALHHVHQTTAQVERMVEHLVDDLGLDRALLVPTGWIRGGYDFSHPEIWPPDAAIGGPEGLASLARRAEAAGWLFGLHDNYQIAFLSQSSSDPGTALATENLWHGGPHYRVDPRAQLPVAMGNLDRIVPVVQPSAYFLDAATAGALPEDIRRQPPLTRRSSIAAHRELLDRVGARTGVVGSEDGQEWAIGHAHYFEGLASDARYPRSQDSFPLFEYAYHDAVAIFWHMADSIGLVDGGEPGSRTVAHADAILDLLAAARMPLFRPPDLPWWEESVPQDLVVTSPFARADGGWAEGMHPLDALLKNLYEVMSPTATLAADRPLTGPGRFGNDDLVITRGRAPAFGDARPPSEAAGLLARSVDLQAGSHFLVEAPSFLAWHGGMVPPFGDASRERSETTAPEAALFTIRSLDGVPLDEARRLRVFHGFGPDELELQVDATSLRVDGVTHPVVDGHVTIRVPREALLELEGRAPAREGPAPSAEEDEGVGGSGR